MPLFVYLNFAFPSLSFFAPASSRICHTLDVPMAKGKDRRRCVERVSGAVKKHKPALKSLEERKLDFEKSKKKPIEWASRAQVAKKVPADDSVKKHVPVVQKPSLCTDAALNSKVIRLIRTRLKKGLRMHSTSCHTIPHSQKQILQRHL